MKTRRISPEFVKNHGNYSGSGGPGGRFPAGFAPDLRQNQPRRRICQAKTLITIDLFFQIEKKRQISTNLPGKSAKVHGSFRRFRLPRLPGQAGRIPPPLEILERVFWRFNPALRPGVNAILTRGDPWPRPGPAIPAGVRSLESSSRPLLLICLLLMCKHSYFPLFLRLSFPGHTGSELHSGFAYHLCLI